MNMKQHIMKTQQQKYYQLWIQTPVELDTPNLKSRNPLPVAAILEQRYHNGVHQYRVQWADTNAAETSWVDADKLQDCDLLLYNNSKRRKTTDTRRYQTTTATVHMTSLQTLLTIPSKRGTAMMLHEHMKLRG